MRRVTSSCTVVACMAFVASSILPLPLVAASGQTVWEAMLRENPQLLEDRTFGALERAVLEALTPEQYGAFLDGADARSLVLASGETLADLLRQLPSKTVVAGGLVYFPLPNCAVVSTSGSVLGKMNANETRSFLIRGAALDLAAQGGSATGCGVPASAEAIVASFRVFSHDGNGKLRAAASDQSLGAGSLLRYDDPAGRSYNNATVLPLCLTAPCTSDFQVRAQGSGSRTHLAVEVLGYFTPLLNAEHFQTLVVPNGTNPVADSATDTLSLTEGGIVTLTGDATTDTVQISAVEVDGSTSNELQNLFATVSGDTGSTTADALADTLNVVGGGLVSTAIVGDTLTITGSGGARNTLDEAYDEGSAGAGRIVTADSGAVRIEGAGGLDLDTGSLLQSPGNLSLVGSLVIGGGPESVYVSGLYAYVVDRASADLKVIDVSDPRAPSLVGSLGIGRSPVSLYVSGRYAYVVDRFSDDLKVIDVSDPSTPSLVGSLVVGGNPFSVYVSGRYAYVVDLSSNDLRVIDVSDPNAPSLAGSLVIGGGPESVYVSGLYAYVVDSSSSDLKVIDVSDPGSPSLVGSLGIGVLLELVYVSGRYAYVVDRASADLKVIDVSDPSAPSLAGSLGGSGSLSSLYVSGSYAYVGDITSNDLKVIDVSDPSAPRIADSLVIGGAPRFIYVSGRYAYVVDGNSDDLKVIDVSGAEVTSLIAHSLEAGNLQVRNDVIAQGQLQVTGGLNVGSGGMFSDGNVGISGTLALANDLAPTSSPANGVQLYAEDVAGSSALKVRDEAGNVTTLSPHNFSLIGQPSEPLAWSYYSETEHGRINVDMLRTVRLIEQMSGETLVHLDPANGLDGGEQEVEAKSLRQRLEELESRDRELELKNRGLEQELESRNRRLEQELGQIKSKLGLQ